MYDAIIVLYLLCFCTLMKQEQKEHIDRVEDNIEISNSNVESGARFLEKASKYKMMTYPLVGAVIGTCIGGPIGLLAGLKLGGLTALGGGVLGKF